MIYFTISCELLEPFKETNSREEEDVTGISPEAALRKLRRKENRQIATQTDTFCDGYEDKLLIGAYSLKEDSINIFAVVHTDILIGESINGLCKSFLKQIGVKAKINSINEITEESCKRLLRQAKMGEFLNTSAFIWDKVSYFNNNSNRLEADENIVSGDFNKKSALCRAKNFLCDKTLVPEIERIYKRCDKTYSNKFLGHPVHYIVYCKDSTIAGEIIDTLVGSLYKCKRVLSKRYAKVTADYNLASSEDDLENLYENFAGGSVVVKFDIGEDNEYAHWSDKELEIMGKYISRNKNKVLTIFLFSENQKVKNSIFTEMAADIQFVEISEEVVSIDRAVKFICEKARASGILTDKSIEKYALDKTKSYTASELNVIFENYRSSHLRHKVYPQYSSISNSKFEMSKKATSALSELDSLVGLASVKGMVHKALDFYKAQKIYEKNGIKTDKPSMHMVFTGNPGTAKTTVARLFAKIMKENGLLSVGNLYEVGRSDLVGKYVGWTAKTVKQHFKMAQGSVLFIDEAYSFVDDRAGLYGDEAINTIVQEMENMRDDIVVIFAGYPDKMSEFVARNNGLKSRIAHHLDFPDYSVDELFGITDLMVKKHNMKLGSGVYDKLEEVYKEALRTPDFGNGRFVRNVLEKALMSQASRLVKFGPEKVNFEMASSLLAEDFEFAEYKSGRQAVKQFGFRTG